MRKTRTIMMMVEGGQYELAVNPPELTVTQESKDRTIDLLNVGRSMWRETGDLLK